MRRYAPFAIAAAFTCGTYLAVSRYAHSAPVPIRLEPVAHAPYDPVAIARNIAFHRARVSRDPKGPIGWAMLADAYLAESREYDRDTAAWAAESAARRSLSLRTYRNERAKLALISSLLEQHRFTDALGKLDDFAVLSGRLRADVLVELGRYGEAEKLLVKCRQEDPAALATRARIYLAEQQPGAAIGCLQKSIELAEANAGVDAKALAWYQVKLGDAYVADGRADEAIKSYRTALSLYPRSYKAHLAIARLSLKSGDAKSAIKEGKATLAIANSLDARVVIADAMAKLGRRKEAETWYASAHRQFLDEIATFDRRGHGGPLRVRPIDRQFATFAASHHRWVAEGLAAAKRDLKNRPDPHAHEMVTVLEREMTQ